VEHSRLACVVLCARLVAESKLRFRDHAALAMVLSPFLLGWMPAVLGGSFEVWAVACVALVPTGAILAVYNVAQAARWRRAGGARRGISAWSCTGPLWIVLVYVGLFAMVRWTVRRGVEEARPDTARVQAWDLAKAADLYRIKTGAYPEALEDLTSSWPRVRRPIMERIPSDPWARPFRYVVRSGTVTICSDGEDAQPATDDDLCVTTSSTGRGMREGTR
jgi:general secretion pathway protein G